MPEKKIELESGGGEGGKISSVIAPILRVMLTFYALYYFYFVGVFEAIMKRAYRSHIVLGD